MANAISGRWLTAAPTAVGIRSIAFFDLTGPDHSAFGWQLQVGVKESFTEGTPSSPSLWLAQPGAWRFRWQVVPGAQTISVYAKQPANIAPYPSMVVRANSIIGVNADVTGASAGGAGWVKIGPITVTPSSAGVVWVELRANCMAYNPASGIGQPWMPCYFDNLGT